MNISNCGGCEHFDPVIRGTKPTPWGWCVKNSTYPAKEGPGQVFPPGVKRVTGAERPAPHIVRKEQIVPNCTLYLIRTAKPTKQELMAKLLSDANGKVILR
jgi:hypothetical protein